MCGMEVGSREVRRDGEANRWNLFLFSFCHSVRD